jgi:hypothetical protein
MSYTEEKHKVFTEEGVSGLLRITSEARELLSKAGAFKASAVVEGDAWLCLNLLDRLKEEGYLSEVTDFNVMGQDRVYVAGTKTL